MVHDRNCKVRMVGRFLLRNILAVGDILWAYFSFVCLIVCFFLPFSLGFFDCSILGSLVPCPWFVSKNSKSPEVFTPPSELRFFSPSNPRCIVLLVLFDFVDAEFRTLQVIARVC